MMSDEIIEVRAEAEGATVEREETREVFPEDRFERLIWQEVVELESTERVRDALSEGYSRIFGSKASIRPNADRIRDRLIQPFFAAIPELVEIHGRNDEHLHHFLAEVLNIVVGIRNYQDRAIALPSTYNTASEGEDGEIRSETVYFKCFDTKIVVGPTFKSALQDIARGGGVWAVLADEVVLSELNASDPVSLLNWLAEFRQFASNCSFKVKLEGQQLKMLQAFFRTA
jgi:hypothetical protein